MDASGREVYADDFGRAEAREGERVGADVALQVDGALAGEGAEEGEVEGYDGAQGAGVGEEVVDCVFFCCGVLDWREGGLGWGWGMEGKGKGKRKRERERKRKRKRKGEGKRKEEGKKKRKRKGEIQRRRARPSISD